MEQQIQFIGLSPNELKKDFVKEIKESLIPELKKEFQPKQPTEYLSRNDVAEMLSIDISSVHNWTKKGILTAFQIGGRIYYKRHQVEAAIVKLEK